jgi:hypothetical protein
MDNENLNLAIFKLLKKEFPILPYIPCSVRSVQLAVNKILRIQPLTDWREKIDGLIDFFEGNKHFRIQLKKLQVFSQSGSTKTPLWLIRPNLTRWTSRFKAYERIIKLKSYFDSSFIQDEFPFLKRVISVKCWENLEKLITFLEPFMHVTDILQSDSSQIYLVWLCFKRLAKSIELMKSLTSNSFYETALHILREEWLNHVNEELVYASSFLSCDFSDMEFLLNPIFESTESHEYNYTLNNDMNSHQILKAQTSDWIADWGA